MSVEIQFNASLQPHNSMAVPAQAHALARASSLDELKQTLSYAKENALNILVLGEGSNTIFECDYSGLVILNRLKGIELIDEDQSSVTVRVAAGENWHSFVEHAVDTGWYGIENLALIPGLVGAAPMQNIGAYGVEVKDTILSVDYIDIDTGKSRSRKNEQCDFAYRESCFKNELAGKIVITAVTFRFYKEPKVDIRYPALSDCLPDNPTPKDVFNAVIQVRQRKLPLPAKIPNTGSFFKNPIVSSKQHKKIKLDYPELVSYPVDGGVKLAAGWLIEQAGWKQKTYKGIAVHREQALVLINPHGLSGRDVLAFAKQIQVDIRDKFGVTLEIEPRVYR